MLSMKPKQRIKPRNDKASVQYRPPPDIPFGGNVFVSIIKNPLYNQLNIPIILSPISIIGPKNVIDIP